jgi:hypothetical protein
MTKIRPNDGDIDMRRAILMTLDVNRQELTIMGVEFDNRPDFEAVWYAVSSNMIAGWQPKVAFIEKMKRRMIELRKGIANV